MFNIVKQNLRETTFGFKFSRGSRNRKLEKSGFHSKTLIIQSFKVLEYVFIVIGVRKTRVVFQNIFIFCNFGWAEDYRSLYRELHYKGVSLLRGFQICYIGFHC